MSKRISYKGYIINPSSHARYDGGFSANGYIEDHQGRPLSIHRFFDEKSTKYSSKKDADEAFVKFATSYIDKNFS